MTMQRGIYYQHQSTNQLIILVLEASLYCRKLGNSAHFAAQMNSQVSAQRTTVPPSCSWVHISLYSPVYTDLLKCAYGFIGICGGGGGKQSVEEILSCLSPSLFHPCNKVEFWYSLGSPVSTSLTKASSSDASNVFRGYGRCNRFIASKLVGNTTWPRNKISHLILTYILLYHQVEASNLSV